MIKKSENDIFLNSLKGVEPIKKNNKISKKIPTIKKSETTKKKLTPKTPLTTGEKKDILPKKLFLKIEKNNINKKLKKGKIPINRKIDFHGCSLESAKSIFLKTINECYQKNLRCILFVTGKGIRALNNTNQNEKKLYYGKIRNEFTNWTSLAEVQSKILNIEQANNENGGDGAFFVYLRKLKN